MKAANTARRILALVGLIGAAACGRLGMGGPSAEDALIVFRNDSQEQADVYAVGTGSDFVRIGTVFPGRTDTLRVRSSLVASGSGVNIMARLLARSNTPSTGNIALRSGDIYQVTLNPDGRTLIALPGR